RAGAHRRAPAGGVDPRRGGDRRRRRAGAGDGVHRRAPLQALTATRAITLDGEAVAAEIKADLAGRIRRPKAEGVTPGLGTLLVGDDGPSATYVAMKHRDAAELGIASFDEHLPADA